MKNNPANLALDPLSALDSATPGASALVQAQTLQTFAAAAGFEWRNAQDILAKLDEEIAELRAAMAEGSNPAHTAEELGDVMFVLTNLARHLGLDAEIVMQAANAKFTARFKAMEALARLDGNHFNALPLESQALLWQRVKARTAS